MLQLWAQTRRQLQTRLRMQTMILTWPLAVVAISIWRMPGQAHVGECTEVWALIWSSGHMHEQAGLQTPFRNAGVTGAKDWESRLKGKRIIHRRALVERKEQRRRAGVHEILEFSKGQEQESAGSKKAIIKTRMPSKARVEQTVSTTTL